MLQHWLINMSTLAEAQTVLDRAELIYTAEEVSSAIDKMAEQLNKIFAHIKKDQPVLALSIMNGGLILSGHLLTRLDFPLQIDYLHASRYRNQISGGELHWKVEPQHDLAGRELLIIDDILDEGYTLAAIQQYCMQKQAERVVSAVLVEKHHQRRTADVECDVIGMSVEDRYVFGFGMDYKSYHRNLNGIYAVAEGDG